MKRTKQQAEAFSNAQDESQQKGGKKTSKELEQSFDDDVNMESDDD